MNWFQRTLASVARRALPPQWMLQWYNEIYPKSVSGENVTADSALKYVSFYSAIDLISRTMAYLPLVVMEESESGRKARVKKHPLYRLLHTAPSTEMTSFVWRQTMQSYALRWGNAYAEIVRDGSGRPVDLPIISPKYITVWRADSGELYYVYDDHVTPKKRIEADDMLHIRTLGDGFMGKSPVSLFREAIGVGIGAEKAGAALFGSGMRVSGTFEHPGKLSDTSHKHLQESLKSYQGSENFAKVLITEEGMKWNPMSISPTDAQYLETREFTVSEIARIFHLPLSVLAKSGTGLALSEDERIAFVWMCIGPWCASWEQELNRQLLMPSESGRLYTQFVLEGLLRGNSTQRAAFYKELFYIGGITINEIREKEDMNGIGSPGDVNYVPVNIVNAKFAEDMKPQSAQPKPEEKPKNPAGEDILDPNQTNPEPARTLDAPHWALLRDACGRVVRAEVGCLKRTDPKPLDTAWCISVLDTPVQACAAHLGVSNSDAALRHALTLHQSLLSDAPNPMEALFGVPMIGPDALANQIVEKLMEKPHAQPE